MSRRSHAPIFWLLFGAGGMLAALFGVALVWVTGFDAAYGLIVPRSAFSHQSISAFLAHPLARFALVVLASLFAWHAVHRIYHSLHDLGIHGGVFAKLICYGTALLITAISASVALSIA